ncbi:MAG: glycosyltransferase family 2 protein [Patescibacteria group bacterium]
MKKSTDLSIIILNYNTADWLQNVLESVEQFPLQKYSLEVIVVDNDSTDDSVQMVQKKFPHVKLIQSSENGGFAKGNNQGIKQATGRYIMLLNSDAEFTKETDLDACIEYLDEHPGVAVLSPKLLLPDGSVDLASHRGEPTPWAALTYFAGLEKLIPGSRLFGRYHQTWQNFEQTHLIEACSGAAMIVRKSAIEKVGLLDENFFMYAEDLDWCKRFREANFQIVFFPGCQITHHKYKSGQAKTTGSINPDEFLQVPGFTKKIKTKNQARFHFYETMKQYYSKHYQKSSPLQTWFIHKIIDGMKAWRDR